MIHLKNTFSQKPTLLFINLSLMMLSACSPYPDLGHLKNNQVLRSDKQEETSYKNNETPEIQTIFQINSIGEAKPHFYTNELNWNFNSDQKLELYRLDLNQRETYLGKFLAEDSYNDQNLAENSFYKYELREESGSKLASKSIQIPKDFVVNGKTKLPKDYPEFKRLFFATNSILVTEGRSVNWNLNEIRGAEGAMLQSFDDAETAPKGKNGANSGTLFLHVDFLEGDLLIDWRGQNGGRGLQGAPQTKRAKPGLNGADSRLMRAGDGYSCRTHGSNGGPGSRGEAGLKGGKGFNGGHLEKIEVTVDKKSEYSRLFLNYEVGKAGLGGKGGIGGKGGKGGRGGDGNMECMSGSQGPMGPRGQSGPVGAEGKKGKFLSGICVTLEGTIVQGPCSG